MPDPIALNLDPARMARVEAYAAMKRKTVAELVDSYLRSIADDIVEAALPRGATGDYLVMLRHRGRDSTAGFLLHGGWDEFERPMPGYFYRWAKANPGLIVDGGANTGFYALLAARASAENRVLAFEPDPLVRGLLLSNIEANGLGNQIEVRATALSDRSGTAALYVPSQEHGLIETSASLEGRFKGRHAQVIEVETTTVDAVGGAVRILKLDVAGHEATALEGAERTVSEHRPLIFLEVLDRADFGALSLFIARHGYVDVPMRAQGVPSAQASVTFELDAWNHALVPAEALPRFLALARAEE
ncbi:MAG TPA: FkbM family methyltransferase [Acetobacteraceae bacterium]|nr:FkbM family methyltransferase [Acetobacteraceae bacterium]